MRARRASSSHGSAPATRRANRLARCRSARCSRGRPPGRARRRAIPRPCPDRRRGGARTGRADGARAPPQRTRARGHPGARAAFPDIPHVAVFDTAFHATLPAEARTYALPSRWREEWGIRRYGFHGLSVQWAAERVPVPRLVVCHLGGGCSVTAVREGARWTQRWASVRSRGCRWQRAPARSTSRSSSISCATAACPWMRVEEALEHESGLLGLSETSARIDELERSDDPRSQLALSVFAHRVAGAVGAMATALNGLDALVFTAGIGEGSPRARADVCARLEFLGVELDPTRTVRRSPTRTLAHPVPGCVWWLCVRVRTSSRRAPPESCSREIGNPPSSPGRRLGEASPARSKEGRRGERAEGSDHDGGRRPGEALRHAAIAILAHYGAVAADPDHCDEERWQQDGVQHLREDEDF